MVIKMDRKIKEVFESSFNRSLVEVIISNSTKKEIVGKIKIRPVLIKNKLQYQVSRYEGNQIFHINYEKDNLLMDLAGWIDGGFMEQEPNLRFRQIEILMKDKRGTILISKKGKVSVKFKNIESSEDAADFSHNRKKDYILEENKTIPFLVDLGVMTKEGKVVKAKYDKFRQMNRFLELIEDVLPYLSQERELTIIDFGCGKSYLTFALYHYLKVIKQFSIRIIGLDLKKDVIHSCNTLAKKYGYDKLNFYCGDIADYEGVDMVDMVVTLHACDTATDYALYKAIQWKAKVILSVPCCQHELNVQLDCSELKDIFQYGLIKERTAALFTDALRGMLLESEGYRTQLLEFIDMEHTPKNILIRGVKVTEKKEKKEEYNQVTEFLGVKPTLGCLLSK